MSKAMAFALLSCTLIAGGCGAKSRPIEIQIHQHSPEIVPMTIDTSQVPPGWMIDREHVEKDVFGHSDRKDRIKLRQGKRVKVIIVPDEPSSAGR